MSKVDPSKALEYLRQFPQTAHANLLRIMQRIGFDLQGYVQTNKLQGQALNHRTGWLSSHVHPDVQDLGSAARVTVGVDRTAVPYAAIHEWGFNGSEKVRAHQRIITVCFGKPIDPVTVMVGAFTRQMHMPERSYLRSSLKERLGTYLGWLKGIKHATQ